MNIVLCGMMGVGKSSVGVCIAERTGRMWYDTDVVITDRHGRISDIFEFYGEAHFRSLETEIVRELSERDGLVISTGGGLVFGSTIGTVLCHPDIEPVIDADGLRLKIRILFQDGHGNASRIYSGNVADVEQFDRAPAKGIVLPRTQKAHKLSVLREHAPLIFLNDDLHITPLTRNTAVLSKTPDGARRAYG